LICPMKNSRLPFLPLVIALLSLLFAGCPKQHELSPSDTVVGHRYGGGYHSDFFTGSELYDDNLSPRDISLAEGGAFDSSGRPLASNVMASVYFGFDKSSIDASERNKLTDAAKKLQANPQARLLITGHCSWHGTREYNLALGDRRARSVKNYLQQIGVNASQIETLSRGSLDALEANSKGSVSETSRDRRGDVILVK